MIKIIFHLCFFIFVTVNINGQAKWPIPIYFENYGVYHRLNNEVNLNDTTIISYSEDIYFKVVLFDTKGKSYFESYKKKRLFEKGYFENSLDTLKKYSISVGGHNDRKMSVIKYFHPIKNGNWLETDKGKLVKKYYEMGILKK